MVLQVLFNLTATWFNTVQ